MGETETLVSMPQNAEARRYRTGYQSAPIRRRTPSQHGLLQGLKCIAIGAILTGLTLAAGVPWDASVALGLALSVFIYRILSIARPTADVFEPATLVALYFLVYFVARGLYVYLVASSNRVGNLYYEDFIPLALLYAIVGYLSFLWGYNSRLTSTIASGWRVRWPKWPLMVPATRTAALAAAGLATTYYLGTLGFNGVGDIQRTLFHSKTDPIPGYLPLLNTFSLIATAVAASYFARKRKSLSAAAPAIAVFLLCAASLS